MTDYTINTSFGASYSDISVSSTETSQREVPLPVVPSAPQRGVGENKPVPEKKVPVHNWIFGEIPKIPVLEAVEGIRFDFNYGIRILLPDNAKTYHVAFMDIDTGMTIYSSDAKPGSLVTSTKKFYTNFRLVIHEKGRAEPIFQHEMDLKDKEVMIQIPMAGIGDTIAWFSYVERFQLKHRCKIICVMPPKIIELVKGQYPAITFIRQDETPRYKPYASYYLALSFFGNMDNQPLDYRQVGLHRIAAYILGLDGDDLKELPPRFNLSAPRQIKEKYVCIATQATTQAKYWNNPFGWSAVVKFLKDNGYRVLCIDKDRIYGAGDRWNYIPYGAEDFTGDMPLQDRVNLIKDADFFVGLASGLSWVAWGCKVPVVMISGFSNPLTEFHTPYRIINYHTCHSCFNDMRVEFDHYDFLWCPRHKGDGHQFECTRHIYPEQVIAAIRRIPTFRPAE